MTPLRRSISHSLSVLGILLLLGAALQVVTSTPNSPGLRALQNHAEAAHEPLSESFSERRRLDEALEVLYVEGDDGGSEDGEQGANEETTVHEKEITSEDKSTSTSFDDNDKEENVSKEIIPDESTTTQTTPSATLAGRETEDPLLAQEEGTSTILLDVSLSLTAQRFLAFMAAILGMIWTAHQMSENPDGLYASLCRSILTGFRVGCRIVTCKSCCFGDGRGAAAHRHIPVSTMDYPTDNSFA